MIGKNIFVITGVFFLLYGCTTDSRTDTDSPNAGEKVATKVFFDDPVVGLHYTCSSSSNVKTTNSKGEFTCNEDDNVTFMIGKYKIGTIKFAAGKYDTIRVADIKDDKKAELPYTTNVRRLLQSIDENKADDVITIPKGFNDLDALDKAPDDLFNGDDPDMISGKEWDEAEEANDRADRAYYKYMMKNRVWYAAEYDYGHSVVKVKYNDNMDEVDIDILAGKMQYTKDDLLSNDRFNVVEQDYYSIALVPRDYNGEMHIRLYDTETAAKNFAEKGYDTDTPNR